MDAELQQRVKCQPYGSKADCGAEMMTYNKYYTSCYRLKQYLKTRIMYIVNRSDRLELMFGRLL